ncbi:MAG: hypothetical protein CPDRYMAC_2079 [uncultured Paraburkholderia sp.]|nr:MAG: hypothetical protein CPDRYDRY_2168 [uncultured Paraburkholderia sp.]CAH2922582.1 MAG: hypothetical protein CPDRYMAC_2079 [uncultured Paraburkholderia sp.]
MGDGDRLAAQRLSVARRARGAMPGKAGDDFMLGPAFDIGGLTAPVPTPSAE